jgi:leucyl-tRNA synthetase
METAMSDDDVYDVHAVEAKWQDRWAADPTLHAAGGADDPRPRKYVLDMFPYPSGDLHMGHAEAYAIGDVIARYWELNGFNVLHPMGWDSFGLPAENAAIKRGLDPVEWTYANIDVQAESFRRYAISFDWSRRLHTSDPDYYKWTQWLFLRLWEKGLAYRKASPVNWCPTDQTVLANEQVIQGRCERCDSLVTKRNLTQWFFRITDYADRLLEDMAQLEGHWPERVLTMQRNWIGRSTGAEVVFDIEGHGPVTVFTTRPDTLYGATFFVVAADSALAESLAAGTEAEADFAAYVEEVKRASEIDRLATDRPKTGVFLGRYAVNPVNGERLPVWAADYVLADYGTGAIMAVPAHDQRDLDFAKAFDLPVRTVVAMADAPDPGESGIATPGDGTLVNSGTYDGLSKADAIARITADLESRGLGKAAINYRLRDWLVSRQRYWGAPVPIVHCPSCGEVAVPDDALPVTLPPSSEVDFALKGESPLATAESWVNVPCPKCGGAAKRDADTMDTFVDSSWYFLRFLSPEYKDGPFDRDEVDRWMPVARYTGGVTHAILHLLYARFFTKALYDMGMVGCTEPFASLLNQGMVGMGGAAMSKSRGNLVTLQSELAAHGVDAVRVTMIFAGPPEDDIDWFDVSPGGSGKWLARVWRLAGEVGSAPSVASDDVELRRVMHQTVGAVTQLVESGRYNVVVARLMELTNAIRRAVDAGRAGAPATRLAMDALAVMLSLFAPYTAEESWERLGHKGSVQRQSWPAYDASLAAEDTVTCVVQVNGKVRDRLSVAPDVTEDALKAAALALPGIVRAIGDGAIRTVVVRPPKLVNVVV